MAALVVGSAAQAITGFGFSLVAVPVLVLLVGPIHAVQLVNEAAIAATWFSWPATTGPFMPRMRCVSCSRRWWWHR